MIKHATAGAFVFCRFPDDEWRLGLIEHPRLGRWMAPGGHVENDECQAQAAIREVEEESGLSEVRLLEVGAPPLPGGFPRSHIRVPSPWWIIEQQVPADSHLAEPHVHVDHQYVAIADSPSPVSEPVHPFDWFAMDDFDGLSVFEDTRLLARALFPVIGSIDEAARAGDESDLFRVLAAAGIG